MRPREEPQTTCSVYLKSVAATAAAVVVAAATAVVAAAEEDDEKDYDNPDAAVIIVAEHSLNLSPRNVFRRLRYCAYYRTTRP